MSDHVGNPLGDGAHTAMKHATEIITMLMMGLQRVAHIHTRQEQLRLSQIDTDRRSLQGELRTIQARDRLVWEPALQTNFRSSTLTQAAQAWTAAQPWADSDPQAARAAHQAGLGHINRPGSASLARSSTRRPRPSWSITTKFPSPSWCITKRVLPPDP